MDNSIFPMSKEEKETTLETMRKELSDICMEIDERMEAKKAYNRQLKDQLKPLKDRKKQLLDYMRSLS